MGMGMGMAREGSVRPLGGGWYDFPVEDLPSQLRLGMRSAGSFILSYLEARAQLALQVDSELFFGKGDVSI